MLLGEINTSKLNILDKLLKFKDLLKAKANGYNS